MKDSIQIGKLAVEQWQDYRKLRLKALQTDPLAFFGSYEIEKAKPAKFWQKGLGDSLKEKPIVWLFAKSASGKPMGMIGVLFSQRPKTKHVAHIISLYVKENYRGNGIGKKLIEAILEKIKTHRDVRKVKVTAISSQETAIGLYKSLGFKKVGKLNKELRLEGKFYDEIYFEKFLDAE